MKNNFKLGTDVEFLAIKTIHGEKVFFPMEGLLMGTKTEPEYIDDSKQRGVLLDNVCVEYVCKPATTQEEFVKEQVFMRDYIKTMLATYKLEMHDGTSGIFKDKYLQSENNKEFGCQPACNARTLTDFNPPNADTNLRTASMHLHISLDDEPLTKKTAAKVALLCDLYIGIPSVVLQKDKSRRAMYGKAGEFRYTPYKGVEYRTLGNEYLFDKNMLEMVYQQVETVINKYRTGFIISDKLSSRLENIINNYDVDGAKDVITKFNLQTKSR